MTNNERQKAYRFANGNACTKKYEKTIKGFIMRLYRNMQSRIDGVQKQKHHLYEGKELLDRESFYLFALGSPSFYSLFGKYKENNYNRKFAPSVDRIDSKLGYSITNMEWVTHSENSRRGSVNRHKGNQ